MKLARVQWTVLIVVILVAGAAWTIASRVPAEAAQATRDRARRAAPDFSLDALGGGIFKLADQAGKPVVVNFWASWCPPCRDELPAFEKVYRNDRDKGLVVVGVNVAESSDVVVKFVAETGLTFPIALDVSGETTALYGIEGMPTTFFVRRDGTIHDMVIGGPLTEAAIESKVAELMK